MFERALRLKLRFLGMPPSQHPPSQVDIQYAIAMARGLVPPVRSLELFAAVPDGQSKGETASDEKQEAAASSAADGEKKEPAASTAASGADVAPPAPTAGSERRADAVTEFHMKHDTIEWQKYCWEVRNESFVAYLKSLIGEQSVVEYTVASALAMDQDFCADRPPVDCTVAWSTRINDTFLRMSGASSGDAFEMSELVEVLEACLQAGDMHPDQTRIAISEMKKGGPDHMLRMIQHLTKK